MFGTINATASTTTTVDIDVLSELHDPCTLDGVRVVADPSQKPTWGDSLHFYVLNSDGTTLDKDLGSCAVDPSGETPYIFQDGPEATMTNLTGGQKLRCVYTSVALLVGAKVAVNVQASSN